MLRRERFANRSCHATEHFSEARRVKYLAVEMCPYIVSSIRFSSSCFGVSPGGKPVDGHISVSPVALGTAMEICEHHDKCENPFDS